MAESSTVVYTPDQGQANNLLPWLVAGNNGFGGFGGNLLPGMMLGSGMGFGGFGGYGGGLAAGGIGFLLGLLFGNGAFGNGFGGGWGSNGAGFLSNQINNDSGRELLMNAINSNGEASRAAVQNLATMLGQDFNLINSDVENLKSALSTLALQQAVSVPQIINAIQSGDSDMALQLCKCCCQTQQQIMAQGYENQLATVNQTNQLGTAIVGASQREVDAIADLKTTMVKEFCDAKERDMQDKINTQGDIITQLRNQLDNDRQTAQLQAVIAPIQRDLYDIKCKQPNTVPVQWPALTAVNTTPYVNGGFYGNGWGGSWSPGFGFGGWNNGINF